jgi:hypothetical protein
VLRSGVNRLGLLVVAGLMALHGARAGNAPCSTPPRQSAVCESGVVSKEKLANYALDACSVSRTFEQAQLAGGKLLPGKTLTSAERLLISDPCATAGACRKEDAEALSGARVMIDAMLNDYAPSYINSIGIPTARQFFEDDKATLQCGVNSAGKPIEAPGATPAAKGWTPSKRLRIRGSTDSLFFTNDQPQFASSDKATISSSYTGGNTTRVDKILAVVGYAIWDPLDSPPYGLMPYYGINRNIARPTGKPDSVSADTMDFGILNSFLFRTLGPDPTTHWITVKPDLLVNHKDGSHLASVSGIYTPIHNCPVCVNAYYPVSEHLSIEPILDVRSDFGHYTHPGDTSNFDYRNYWRMGPRAGVSFSSDYPFLPIDLTATDVYEQGVSGTLPHINYLKAVLSFKLVPKFISLDVSFSNGRREDTAQSEHQWSVGLSAAY